MEHSKKRKLHVLLTTTAPVWVITVYDPDKEEWIKALRMNIANEKLIAKFKEAGFGDPFDEERLKEK